MYRLVMIDDEPWALKGLMEILPWGEYGFCVEAGFDDPVQAWKSIRHEPPDAVFTDIRMPVMDGLHLMNKCRDLQCRPVFIVVSAYAEFSYAQKALDNGALSYVLKPFNVRQIKEVARKLLVHLQSQNRQQMRSLLSDCMLQALSFQPGEQEDCPLPEARCIAGPFRVAVYEHDEDSPGNERFDMQSVEIYPGCTLTIESPDSPKRPARLYRGGVSSWGRGSEALAEKLREAHVALLTQRFYGSGPERLTFRGEQHDWMSPAQNILRAVHSGDTARAEVELAAFRSVAESSYINVDTLTLFYNHLLSGMLSSESASAVRETLHPFRDCFAMAAVMGNAPAFFRNLRVLIRDSSQPQDEPDGEWHEIATRVRAYIDENYASPITLELLSEMFHTSLYHLCRIFRRAIGQTYTQYLAQKRIANACKLLASPHLSVREVGERSGYPDYVYFSKVFRKHMGVSPSAYRHSCREMSASSRAEGKP